jgi:PAS domain S-box-containing protein
MNVTTHGLFDQPLGRTEAATPQQLVRTSRAMLLLACVAFPLFGVTHRMTSPTVVDPMALRLGFAGLCAVVYGLTYYSQWIRTHINSCIVGLYYILTMHFFVLLVWNRLDVNYVIGFFIILFCIGSVFITLHSLLYYGLFLTVGSLGVGWLADPTLSHTPLLGGAMATVSILSFVSLNFRLRVTTALSQTNRYLRQEMSERAQAEEKLRENETRYRMMAEYATDLLAKHTPGGVIFYASPACRPLLGYTPEELTGRSCYDFFHPDDVRAIRQQHQDLASVPDVATFTYRMRKKDGEYVWFETINRAVRDPRTGLVQEFLTISRDITTRKEADRLKDELVSTVSHELRTPLTSLRGFAELMLKREFPPAKQREFLSVIHGESLRLTTLINDFLDLQRIESGRQAYDFTATDLAELFRHSVAVFSGVQSPHSFRLNLPVAFPFVRADKDRLQQVFANLVSNAVKFSPAGDVVTLGAHEQGSEAVVWVSDQGVGIPTEAIPRLFNKFFRVENQDTRRIGGTGLGLALVKKIIEAHGGRVWVESTEGCGSTFFFTLPLARAEYQDVVTIV